MMSWVSSDCMVLLKFHMIDDLLKRESIKEALVSLNFFVIFVFFSKQFFFGFCYHSKYDFFVSGFFFYINVLVHTANSVS